MGENKIRNSSIEALRIIAMMGVVILHYNNSTMGGGFSYVKSNTVNEYFLFFTESLFICAVNLYIMISAYFLCTSQKRKLIKVLELLVQVSLFRLFFFLIAVFRGGTYSLRSLLVTCLPVNYFVILYSALYIISPYINILIRNLSKRSLKKLIITLILLFSVWTILVDLVESVTGVPLGGLSTISSQGSQKGYTIVNFILSYFIGTYIKLYGVRYSKKKVALSIVLMWLLIYGISILEKVLGNKSTIMWFYNNPLVIMMSAFVLILTVSVEFESRLINEVAKGAFTCFLFHTSLLGHMGISKAVNSNLLILLAHQIAVAVLLYGISYLVYKIYYLCSHWFFKWIEKLCNRIDISVID